MTKQPAKKAKKAPRPRRPKVMPIRESEYTDDMGAAICVRLAEGESLRSICRDAAMPGLATVFKWLGAHPSFVVQYARAREEQAETLASEIVAIADEECTMVRADKHNSKPDDEDGFVEVVFDATAVARNRLRVDARKWVASKLKPKVYGDKVQTEISGELKVASSKHLTDEQLAAIAAGNG